MKECFDKLKLSNVTLLKSAGQKDVYKGQSQEYGSIVIKIIKPGQNVERIDREIEIIERLKEINTSIIHSHGNIDCEKGSFKYIIESFIEGESLSDYLKKAKKLPYPEVIKFLKQMTNTNEVLEQNGIIHRDIKPDNIMRTNDGNYCLIDFGIARDLDKASLTATDASMGPATCAYAPIEQIDNNKDLLDNRVDLYSTSLIAYEMITGKNPYYEEGDNIPQIIRKVEKGEFLELEREEESEVNEFIHTCMNKYIGRRPPSAAEAKKWIEDII